MLARCCPISRQHKIGDSAEDKVFSTISWPNYETLAISTSEIDKDNIIMVSYDELPEEERLALDAEVERHGQQLFSCYVKTRQGVLKKEDYPPPTNQVQVKPNVSNVPHALQEYIVHTVDQSLGAAVSNQIDTLAQGLDQSLNRHCDSIAFDMQS